MNRLVLFSAAMFCAAPAFAEDPLSVTMTESDLNLFANVVRAQTLAQSAADQARPVLDKIKSTFNQKEKAAKTKPPEFPKPLPAKPEE